jgi:hypothetical protein
MYKQEACQNLEGREKIERLINKLKKIYISREIEGGFEKLCI